MARVFVKRVRSNRNTFIVNWPKEIYVVLSDKAVAELVASPLRVLSSINPDYVAYMALIAYYYIVREYDEIELTVYPDTESIEDTLWFVDGEVRVFTELFTLVDEDGEEWEPDSFFALNAALVPEAKVSGAELTIVSGEWRITRSLNDYAGLIKDVASVAPHVFETEEALLALAAIPVAAKEAQDYIQIVREYLQRREQNKETT